jgi:Leucine-rich repeat (LRR) protein
MSTDNQIITDKFTDENFRKKIYEALGINSDEPLTNENVKAIEKLNFTYSNIETLNGVEYLTALKELTCFCNDIISIQELPDSLEYLSCDHNKLTSLPKLPKSLTTLYCNDNQLTSMPELPCSLKKLHCHYNELTSLPELPDSLKSLSCHGNRLTSLPDLPNSIKELSLGTSAGFPPKSIRFKDGSSAYEFYRAEENRINEEAFQCMLQSYELYGM